MSKTLDVGIRITADGRVLVSETAAAKAALAGLADSAKKAGAESANLGQQQDRQAGSSRKVTDAANEQSSAIDKIRDSLTKGAAAYLSYQAAMAGGKAIIDTALANERLNNTLKVGVGSAEAAAKEIAFLRQESEKLGLQFTTTADQYAKLAAAAKDTALQGQATRDIFLAVSKASTVLGLSAAEAGGALNAIQQMISKGTVSAEELRGQLGERLPGAFQMAARAIGVTTAELDAMLSKGELTAERLLPALATELEKTFGAQAQEAAQGLNAKINRLENSFNDLKAAIGNSGLLDLLSDGIVLATRFVDALSGAKVLSAVDQQKQKIIEMRAELESLTNRQHIPLIGDLLFDKKQADLLSQRIDDGVADLARLEKAAQDSAQAISVNKTVTPGQKPGLPDELVKERERAAKAAESAANRAAEAKAREAKQAVDNSNRIIAALKLETEQIGLNNVQKRMMSAATEAAKAPTKELAEEIMASAAAWAQATQRQDDLAAAEKQRIDALRAVEEAEKEAARASEATARQSSQQWNQMWGSVEQTAKTAFIQFAAHGTSAMKSIGEAIKLSIIDMLYQLTIRKWIINIGSSLESGFANTLISGASSASGIASSVGTGVAGSSNGGSMLGGMNSKSLLSAGSMGGVYGIAAAAAVVALNHLNKKYGDYKLNGGLGSVDKGLDTLRMGTGGYWIGKALGLQPIESLFMKFLFGRQPYKFRQQSLQGDISSTGLDGTITDVYRSKGALFTSNKHKSFTEDIPRDLGNDIDSTIRGIYQSTHEFAENLGLDVKLVDNFTKEIQIKSEKGKTITQEAITEMLGGLSDEISSNVLPAVDQFKKLGETATATLTRLNNEFVGLVNAGTLLGSSVANARSFLGKTGFEGRTEFIDNAGGLDALLQKAQFFADNFLTDAERLAPAQERLNEELGKLGLSTDLTREQFKGLVQSFGSINGISEEMLQSMLDLAPAFIGVRDAQDQLAGLTSTSAQEIANERLALEVQLLQVQGNVTELRRRELEQLDPSNRALQERIWMLQDEQQAAEALRVAAGSAFSELQKSIDAERARLTDDYNTELDKVNTHIQGVTESINKLKSLSDALKTTVNQIRPLNRAQARQQIQDAIDTARRGGELPDADSLRNALSVLGNSQSITGVSSSFEFAKEQAKTANLIAELGGLTDSQLTLEERSLKALESRRDNLGDGFKEQIKRLDKLVEQGQQGVDMLSGLNNAIMSLTNAIGLMNNRILQGGGKPSDLITDPITGETPVSGNPKITDKEIRDFVNTKGRTDMEIYNAAKANGVSFVQYAAATGTKLEDLEAWAKKHNLKTFASGGFHRGGLRIVGERGPELEFTGPSRISSNSDLSRMLNNDALERRLESLEKQFQKVVRHTGSTAKRMRAVTRNGNALRTTGEAA